LKRIKAQLVGRKMPFGNCNHIIKAIITAVGNDEFLKKVDEFHYSIRQYVLLQVL
jgi:hypothetical protein